MLNPALEIETINYARKIGFIEIARKRGLPVKAYMRKAAICDMIIHHYISTNVLGEEAKDYYCLVFRNIKCRPYCRTKART